MGGRGQGPPRERATAKAERSEAPGGYARGAASVVQWPAPPGHLGRAQSEPGPTSRRTRAYLEANPGRIKM